MNLSSASFVLAIAGGNVSLYAAYYWHKASQVEIDPGWNVEPGEPELSQMGWTSGIMTALIESAALNKKAARLTAIAVVLGVASGVAGHFHL